MTGLSVSLITYTNLKAIPTFYIGVGFLASLRDWQADGRKPFAAQTLQSCVAAVLELPTIEIKPFRKAKRLLALGLNHDVITSVTFPRSLKTALYP